MIEIDLEADLEAVERNEDGALVALFYADFALDADELLGSFLLLQSGGLDQEYERTSAAIHDRHFRSGQLDVGVVDTQAGHGREQVLHRIHFDVTLDQGGRHGGFADVLGPGRDFHYRIQVGAAEHDTGVHRRRFQGQVNLFPRVQTDASSPDDVLQGALFDHGFGRLSADCELFSTMAGDDSRTGLC